MIENAAMFIVGGLFGIAVGIIICTIHLRFKIWEQENRQEMMEYYNE